MSRIDQVAVTPTVARQSQQQEFGEVLKNSIQSGARALGAAGTAVLNAVPGSGVVSAAVSAVTNMASQARTSSAASTAGVLNTNTGVVSGGGQGFAEAAAGGDLNSMMTTMRAEANRSMVMQMAMQQESREYNTISNVLKVRHDSAKAAINNIR